MPRGSSGTVFTHRPQAFHSHHYFHLSLFLSLFRAVFTLAEKLQPCIIFIDEVDAMLGKRGTNMEHEATLQGRDCVGMLFVWMVARFIHGCQQLLHIHWPRPLHINWSRPLLSGQDRVHAAMGRNGEQPRAACGGHGRHQQVKAAPMNPPSLTPLIPPHPPTDPGWSTRLC